MSYSQSYDECMTKKGLPLLGAVLSKKTLSEAIEIFEGIHRAIEVSGGDEVTIAGLVALGPALSLSADALEVLGFLAVAGADLAAMFYVMEASKCLGWAVWQNRLSAELDTIPDGAVKAEIGENLEPDEAVA